MLGEGEENFFRAARNLAAHKVLLLAGLNVYDVLNYDEVLMTDADGARDRGAARGRSAMSAESLILAPLITEKGTAVNEEGNQVVFRVRPDASKDEIRDGGRAHVQGHGAARCGRSNLLGKKRRRGRIVGRAFGLEKGLRDAQGRRQDRILRGRLGRDSQMAVIQLNPRTPGQRFMQMADFSGLTKKPPEKRLLAPLKTFGRAQQPRPHDLAPSRRRP